MVRTRVVNQGSESSGPGGGQRPARPPDADIGDVAVVNVLFVGRRFGDFGQRQVVLDEAFFHKGLTFGCEYLVEYC